MCLLICSSVLSSSIELKLAFRFCLRMLVVTSTWQFVHMFTTWGELVYTCRTQNSNNVSMDDINLKPPDSMEIFQTIPCFIFITCNFTLQIKIYQTQQKKHLSVSNFYTTWSFIGITLESSLSVVVGVQRLLVFTL